MIKRILTWTCFGVFASIVSGCYYDNEFDLYPELRECDTANVTYSGVISQIMSVNCNECHGSVVAENNVRTDNYSGLKTIADDGRLLGVINHSSGYPAMPKDKPKLSDCDIKKISIWVAEGAPNN